MPSNVEPFELDEAAKDSLVGAVADIAGTVLGESFYASTDLPGFLADTAPTLPHLAAGKEVARLVCRRYARGQGPGSLPGFNALWGSICEPYLDSIGENPGDGTLEREFEGGQCPVQYKVTSSIEPFPFQDCSTFGPGISDQTYTGPIRGLRFAVENPSGVLCTPGRNVVYLKHGPGNSETLLGGGGYGVKASIVSVQRVDGLPDNCGSPPPLYDPPNIPPGLPPVPPTPIRLPGVGPVNVDVTIGPSGEIVVNLPDINTDVTIEDPFGFGGDVGGDGGGGEGPPPGDPGDPGAPVEVGPGGEAEGEAPGGKVLTGVRVQLLNVPPSKNQYTSEVYRGVYYVYMGTPGLLEHYPSGAMVTSDQFTFASQDYLTSWRVRANDKWSIRTTPYYRETS